jgi:NADH-quinone oxidoreductase subunit J
MTFLFYYKYTQLSLQFFMFSVLAVFAIASAVFVIINKNPIASAIGLVFHFFMLAGLYLTLQAQFIAVLQILIYAGAIMVLVVFVIMLLNVGVEEKLKEKININRAVALILSIVFVAQIGLFIILNQSNKNILSNNSLTQGTVEALGKELFTNYLVPFIIIGILLTVAIIGAVILAKRRLEEPKN